MQETQRATTILLSTIGLSFGLFQVLLNISIQGARNTAQLRYSEFKELAKLMSTISEILNKGVNEPANVKELHLLLTNIVSEFTGFMNNNSYLLFKGLNQNQVVLETKKVLISILNKTIDYRNKTTSLKKSIEATVISEGDKAEAADAFLHEIWVNNIREDFKKYSKLKYEVLKEVQDYL